jgi:putative Holliday junction resolvase
MVFMAPYVTIAAVRVLALDIGTKTIGVAVSDELGLAAHPRQTMPRRGNKIDVEMVAGLLGREGASRVVVGLPLELSGAAGKRAKQVEGFVALLRDRLGLAVPVETWDERFSTAGAERILIEADLSRARRKQVIDAQAAVFILQGWLDARRTSG